MVPAEHRQANAAATERARPTLVDRVHEQVLRLIIRGEFPRECKLPTEAELCERFGVSRTVVRAALIRLRADGHLRSQQGSGWVVMRGPEPGALRYPPIRSVADLERSYEFRIAVEGQAAWLAATRHTAEDLRAIEDALAEADSDHARFAPDLAPELNFRFHRAVARATGNPFFTATLEAIPNLIGAGPVELRYPGLDDPEARRRLIVEEHREIHRAIASRDAAGAKAAIERHIASARQFVFERQAID
jgi:GntR family transcriptional repressor for pyruvate dehydrogenase complex